MKQQFRDELVLPDCDGQRLFLAFIAGMGKFSDHLLFTFNILRPTSFLASSSDDGCDCRKGKPTFLDERKRVVFSLKSRGMAHSN